MHLIELAFGHCRSDGSILPIQQIALAELRGLLVFSHCFRGSQVHHLVGAYLTTENCVVIEPSTVIRAYAEEVAQHVACLKAVGCEIAYALSQECVLLTIVCLQGTMHWLEPEASILATTQPALASLASE